MNSADLLTPLLIDPSLIQKLDLRDWDLLIRQARQSNLLGRLAALLAQRQRLSQVPHQPRAHLESSLAVAQRQTQAVRWEVDRIEHALANIPPPIMLLKGAAYIMLQLPCAQGRLFSDVDILVPKPHIEAAELALKMNGWITTLHDAYDQRYYRKWMHELPPMTHLTRQTFLDVHHTILPETARLHPDPQKLIDAAVPLPGHAGLKVLAPVDMLLHSATHLFHEGEFDKGLRDLSDLDILLRHFSGLDPDFWRKLSARAIELDLARPLFYALRYTMRILQTPVPPDVLQAASQHSPDRLALGLMDPLFSRAFRPHHASCEGWLTRPALMLLYVRSHWLKMPFPLLARHLFHKAFISPKDTPS